ncbi:MAG: hypothetical protein WCR40_00510 [Candidatus Paceibacterota bacterium]
MFNFIKKLSIFILFFAILLGARVSFSQEMTSYGSQQNPILINSSISNPRAGDIIKLTVSSYSINLDSSKITWYVDKEIKKDETGAKELTINTQNTSESITIKVTVITPDGLKSEATKTLSLAGVDLIVEATSYVSPMYRGKASFTNQGIAKVVAIPDIKINGKKILPRNLVFRWKKDNIALSGSSGIGKDSLMITGSVPIKDINVSVEIMDSSGKTLASRSINISPKDPKIIFYEDSPLYGVLFNKAINGTFNMGDREELKIVAKPFFFNIDSDSGSDSKYKWSVNNKSVSTKGKTNQILLRQTNKEVSGTTSIELEINNLKRIFQFTNNSFNITFGQ